MMQNEQMNIIFSVEQNTRVTNQNKGEPQWYC